MKRSTKNIIFIAIIVLLIFSIVFTIHIAKNNLTNNNNPMVSDNTEEEAKKDIPISLGTNGEEQGQGFDNNDGSAPPEIPTGQGNFNDGENPPAKPDGEEGNIQPENGNMNGGENPPEKPDGDSNDGGNIPDLPGEGNESSSKLTTPYYILLGFESLLLALLLTYFVQSKFNKKQFKETYYEKDKVIIAILIVIILTSFLTFGISYLTNNVILQSSSSSKENPGGNMGGNTGGSSGDISYSSATSITEDKSLSNVSYSSDEADENALSISGDIEVNIDNLTITKEGDSDGGDNTSFYGINSGVIAKDGATLTIKNANITTNAVGGNGVFSYGGTASTKSSSGDGTTVNISDSTIVTKKDNSGGIMTTGGGITNATNLTVTTAGTSSAAIRTDRGGGTVTVDGGTYTTTGLGSPAIYSTANILVKNAILISEMSEGAIIEGKNEITLENVTLTDTNSKLNGQSTTYKNIFLYQSMSGDADTGTSKFTATNSTITTNNGDSFYVTNTTAVITLTNNTIVNNDESGNFLRAMADSWGNSGSNGGYVTLTASNQEMNGNIVIDSISTLDFSLSNSSKFIGKINSDNTAKSISLTLDKTSTIKLTGNSYVTSLDNEDTTNSNIDFNGYKLYVNGTAIN